MGGTGHRDSEQYAPAVFSDRSNGYSCSVKKGNRLACCLVSLPAQFMSTTLQPMACKTQLSVSDIKLCFVQLLILTLFVLQIISIYKRLIIKLNSHSLNISVSHVTISKRTQIEQSKPIASIKDFCAGKYGFRGQGNILSANANRVCSLWNKFHDCRQDYTL